MEIKECVKITDAIFLLQAKNILLLQVGPAEEKVNLPFAGVLSEATARQPA